MEEVGVWDGEFGGWVWDGGVFGYDGFDGLCEEEWGWVLKVVVGVVDVFVEWMVFGCEGEFGCDDDFVWLFWGG